MKQLLALLAIAAFAAATPAGAGAQVRLWVDALGSTARPPADVVNRDASTYGLAGLRLERATSESFVQLMLQGATGATSEDGRWVNAGMLGIRQWSVGGSTLNLTGDAFLLRYSKPFDYTAGAIALKPQFVTGLGPLDLELFGAGSMGRWSTRYALEPAFPPVGGPTTRDTVLDGQLSLLQVGTGIGFEVNSATLRAAVSATRAINGSADGWYRMAEASVFATRGPFQAQVATRLQRYDGENELGFSVAVQREVFGSAQVHASLTRAVRDPQFSTPAHLGLTLGMSVPLFGGADYRSVVTPVAEVVGSAQGGRRVRFTVRAPGNARVQLVGSFTNWQPTSMQKNGERWTTELPVPVGSHQFAFLLDGKQWFVPDDAPGVVDDGFGKRNATLVVSR